MNCEFPIGIKENTRSNMVNQHKLNFAGEIEIQL
jgi:hypothetical protein